jgi:hypothetical protein
MPSFRHSFHTLSRLAGIWERSAATKQLPKPDWTSDMSSKIFLMSSFKSADPYWEQFSSTCSCNPAYLLRICCQGICRRLRHTFPQRNYSTYGECLQSKCRRRRASDAAWLVPPCSSLQNLNGCPLHRLAPSHPCFARSLLHVLAHLTSSSSL